MAGEPDLQTGTSERDFQGAESKTGICRYSAGNTERMCEGTSDVRLFPKNVTGAFESVSAG